MQHFSKHSRIRLLALCLSAGLVMGGLSGCDSQGSEIADAAVGSATSSSEISASADTTSVTAIALPDGPEESTV